MSISRFRHRRALALGALLTASCYAASPLEAVLAQNLARGGTVADAVARDSAVVVLVYDPSMCYSCSTMLSDWEANARAGRTKVMLVLASAPTEEDQRALQLQRIAVAAIATAKWPTARVPSEFVFRNGQLVSSAIGRAQVDRMDLARRGPFSAPRVIPASSP